MAAMPAAKAHRPDHRAQPTTASNIMRLIVEPSHKRRGSGRVVTPRSRISRAVWTVGERSHRIALSTLAMVARFLKRSASHPFRTGGAGLTWFHPTFPDGISSSGLVRPLTGASGAGYRGRNLDRHRGLPLRGGGGAWFPVPGSRFLRRSPVQLRGGFHGRIGEGASSLRPPSLSPTGRYSSSSLLLPGGWRPSPPASPSLLSGGGRYFRQGRTRLRRGIEPVTSLSHQKVQLSASNPRLQESLSAQGLGLGSVLLDSHELKRPVLRRPAILASVVLPQSSAHVLAC